MTKEIAIDKFGEIGKYIDNFKSFAEDCLFVRDHNTKKILPFILNNPQRITNNIIEKQNLEMGFVRVILDKARRFGGSTLIEGRGYHKTSMNFNINAFIIAHEEDSTDTLFNMAKLFHERNPIAPQTKYSSKKELLFDTKDGNGLKSEYGLACAKNPDALRSQGVHFFHGSEVAFWPGNADALLDGAMSAFPADPIGTEAYLESTGNGYGNRFQRDVFAAYCEGKYPYYIEDGIPYAWKNHNDSWVLIFIPWFAHDLYLREFDNDGQKAEFAAKIKQKVFNKELMSWEDSPETKLINRYHVSLEQLNWRQWEIENTFKGRVNKFQQEFPATVEESFLSQGSNTYPAELCDIVQAGCKAPLLIGDPVDRIGKTKIRPNPYGHLSIWSKPNPDNVYFMTVDCGGGKNERQKKEKTDPDPTCIDVWDRSSGEQVAQWHGHIQYDLIADMVELIGKLYNRGIACVEVMNHGYTVVAGLRALKYPMYESKPGEPGWYTTSRSKPQMVDGLYEAARDGALQIRCAETVAEMRTFVEKNGKYNAESGCHDERVDTAGIASQMMKLLPSRSKAKRDEVSLGDYAGRNNHRESGGYVEVRL
ncbi:MAG: hypothetical protein WC389_13030 [Lutibacter sp.]|jgi:hypothetical protein